MSSSGNNNSSRKGKGRQKVDMVKIENETNLQVTFSKRRAGLFKKASELSTLCGAETAVVVFSPGNKAHSFGHPNVDTVANRFLNQSVPPMSDVDKLLEAHQKANINQQNLELNQLQNQLELEQKRAHELERMRKEGQRQKWCPPDIDKLDFRQLDRLKGALLKFGHQLEYKVCNATAFAPPYLPGSIPNPGTREVFQRQSGSGPSFGNSEKLALDDDAAIPYDPMASDSCRTIPYSSTATTSSVDPNER